MIKELIKQQNILKDSAKRNIDDIGTYSGENSVQNARAIKYTADTQNAVEGFKMASNALHIFKASLTKAQKNKWQG